MKNNEEFTTPISVTPAEKVEERNNRKIILILLLLLLLLFTFVVTWKLIISKKKTATLGQKHVNPDYVASKIEITPSTTEWTNEEVLVSIKYTTGLRNIVELYSIDNGNTYEEYVEPIKIEKNMEVKAQILENEIGDTIVAKSLNITNIDRLAPKEFSIKATPKNQSIIIEAKTEDEEATKEDGKSGIKEYEYIIKNEDWKRTITLEENVCEFSGLELGRTYKVQVIAIDNAGNKKASEEIEVNIPKPEEPKTPEPAPTPTPEPTKTPEPTPTPEEPKEEITITKLKINPNGGVWNSSYKIQEISKEKGFIYKIENPTRIGYTFKEWITSSGKALKGNEYTYSEADEEITAAWEINTYTLSLNAMGGNLENNNITKEYKTDLTLPVPTLSYTITYDTTRGNKLENTIVNYNFAGWYTEETSGEERNYTKMPAQNETLYAHWDNLNAKATLPLPTREGYTFEGWYTDSTLTTKIGNAGEEYTPTKDVTLYAKWQINSYTLTLDPTGGNVGASIARPQEITQNFGTNISMPIPTKEYTINFNTNGGNSIQSIASRYTFEGWYTNEVAGEQRNYLKMPAQNETLYAHWSNTSASIKLPLPTKEGYIFAGWYQDSNLTKKVGNVGENYTATKDITLYAKWTTNQHTLTLDGNGTTVTPNTITANFDEDITLPTSTRTYTVTFNVGVDASVDPNTIQADYTFAGWYTDKTAGDKKEYTKMPAIDETLYAHWDSTSAEITLPTPSKEGYAFEGWYEDSTFTTKINEHTYTPTQDITLYAKWNVNSYTLTLDANGGNVTTATITENYDTAITLPIPTRTHTLTFNTNGGNAIDNAISTYAFEGWYTEAENGEERNYLKMPAQSETLYAHWDNTNASVTLPTPSKEGSTFDGWYEDANFTTKINENTYTLTKDTTIYAKWNVNSYTLTLDGNGTTVTPTTITENYDTDITLPTPTKQHTITFNTNGGNTIADKTATYTFAGWYTDATNGEQRNYLKMPAVSETLYAHWDNTTANVTLPLPTKEGFTFSGWYSDESFTTKIGNNGEKYAPTQDTTIYAKWTVNPYTLTFDAGNDAQVNPQTIIAEYGENITMPSPTLAYTVTFNTNGGNPIDNAISTYTFAGWYTKATNGEQRNYTTMPAQNETLYAHWDNTNASVILPTPSKEGATFDGWYEDSTFATKINENTYTPTKNVTLYAKWNTNSYTLTLDANTGTVTPTTITGNYNEDITLPTPTKQHTVTFNTNGGTAVSNAISTYTFGGWYTDKTNGEQRNYTKMPAIDETLYAHWDSTNAIITLPNTTKEGHMFVGWYSDSAFTTKIGNAGEYYTPTADTTIYAKWEINSYTLTFDANTGNVTPTTITENYNTDITMPSPTKEYTVTYNTNGGTAVADATSTYTFSGWYTDKTVGEQRNYTKMPAGDETLYAHWDNTNASVTLPTTSKEGYTFDGWYEDASFATKINENTYTPTADTTIYAKWIINSYTLTLDANTGTVTPTTITENYNTDITLPTPTKQYTVTFNTNGGTTAPNATSTYTFSGWYTDKTAGDKREYTKMPAQSETLYAHWDNTNASVTLPTTSKEGYTFDGWYKESSFATKINENTYTPTENTTLYAKWNVNSYTLILDPNGGSVGASIARPQEITQNFGTDITLPSPTKTTTVTYNTNGGNTISASTLNYTFSGWYTDATNGEKREYTKMPAGDETLYAHWDSTTAKVALPMPTKTGYSLEGWYEDASLTTKVGNAGDYYTTSTDTTLYAKWEIESYTVTYNANGGEVTPSNITKDYNTSIKLPLPTKTGYKFAGWYSDTACTDANKVGAADASYTIVEDITLYAKWDKLGIFVKLYSDGELAFTDTDRVLEEKTNAGITMTKDYGDITGLEFTNADAQPWKNEVASITSVDIVDTIQPTSTAFWFGYCTNLTMINNIGNLDTSKVTNMRIMFTSCSSLNSLDVSNFDTSNVTDMTSMFNGCSSLTNIDVSKFGTSNVTTMHRMFFNCSSLTSLNLGSFNTINVTAMTGIFEGCSSLTSLDLSSFDTSNVTDINGIFTDCTSLEQISFGSKWNKEITLPTPVKTDFNFTGWYSDKDCTNRVAEGGAYYTPAAPITIYAGMAPNIYVKLYTDGTLAFTATDRVLDGKTLAKSYGNIYGKEFASGTQPWDSEVASVKTVDIVDKIQPTSTQGWFIRCNNLTAINNIANLDTSKVTSMKIMFYGCSSLSTVDLSNFDTSNVTTTYSMFYNCSGLTELNVSKFNTSKVTTMANMFNGCNQLTSLELSSFDTSNLKNTDGISPTSDVFKGCTSLAQITFGANWNKEVTLPTPTKGDYVCDGWYSDSAFTNKVADAGGTYTPSGAITIYADVPPDIYVKLYDDGTLAFTATDKMLEGKTLTKSYGNIAGKEFTTETQPWKDEVASITSVDIVDAIQPISTAFWFGDCENLTIVNNISNLDTSNSKNMRRMFYCCRSITNLDVSGFNTSNVTDMNSMFNGCIKLEQLDVRSFNTSKVTNMHLMFYECSSLKSLNVSNFDTSNVTDMIKMFAECSSLTSLDLSSFDTSQVITSQTTNMKDTFRGCTSLTEITFGSNWDKEITLPTPVKTDFNFTGWYSDKDCTNKVAEGGALYTPAAPITIYAGMAPNIYVKLYTDGTLAFTATDRVLDGKTLTKSYGNIYGQEFSLNAQLWKDERSSITSVNIVDSIQPNSTENWFAKLSNLKEIDGMQNIDTINVEYMRNMFYECENIVKLDLSSFNTTNLKNFENLFEGCTSLTQITFGPKWNKEVTLPTPEKADFNFTGWYSDKDCTNKVAEGGANYTPAGAITIYAGFVPAYYGGLITNYSAGGVSAWRVFHKDENGRVYLIADDYIPYTSLPTTTNGESLTKGDTDYKAYWNTDALNSYTGSEWILSNTNANARKWLNKYLTANPSSTNDNIKAVAYMMDTNKWSKFVNSTYAEYAIGGPTIELFCESYKKTHPDRYIECDSVDSNGYKVKWSDGAYTDYIENATKNDYKKIYINSDTSKATSMWLASTTSTTLQIIAADSFGCVGGIWYGGMANGFRPIVCLNSGMDIISNGDGTYSII